jgi:anion-transporting  ArsA/GET3 family ATPase
MDQLTRKLIFVGGKGGVGKTVVSQALALNCSRRGLKTLYIAFEDPTRVPGELRHLGPNLQHLNCDAAVAFEEYIGLKLKLPAVTRVFLQNKLIQYLAKAAPGLHELVLLGKVWHERLNHDVIVTDMPSTGYGIAMFQSTENFARLFEGGPIHRDAQAMLETFHDPRETGHVIVSLPEEMPLRESLELEEHLRGFFPKNPSGFIVNRRFPHVKFPADDTPDSWPSPVPSSAEDYARKRSSLEDFNLRLWREREIRFDELAYVPPPERESHAAIVEKVAEQLLAIQFAAPGALSGGLR